MGLWVSPKTDYTNFELDEVFWFEKRKSRTENRANLYTMTMMSRIPRQIVGLDVDKSVNAIAIQRIVDSVPPAQNYFTDGGVAYLDVDFLGRHRRNIHDKSDTHLIESTNADLRHYIPMLARRKRCFPRSIANLKVVLLVFVNAYNKFGEWKLEYYRTHKRGLDLPCSILDFI